jgi:hypothetical protein
MLNHKNAKTRKMKTNPHHPTGFGSCSDRALAEKATALYDAISNHTGLANQLPGLEAFNVARLAFIEALEKANPRTRDDIAAKNAHRRKLAIGMAALKDYVPTAPNREAVKLEKPAFFNLPISRPQPVRRKTGKAASEKPGQFLLVVMFLKMIQGMRSYWHAAGSNQHL